MTLMTFLSQPGSPKFAVPTLLPLPSPSGMTVAVEASPSFRALGRHHLAGIVVDGFDLRRHFLRGVSRTHLRCDVQRLLVEGDAVERPDLAGRRRRRRVTALPADRKSTRLYS